MRKKAGVIGGRIAADLKSYRWVFPALLIYDVVVTACFGAFCPMVIVTGLPCPGCGMTRAALLVLCGQWAAAFRYNPSVWLWLLIGIYFAWNRYVKGEAAAGILPMIGGAAAVMIAVYFYRMAVCFPGEPPMVLYEGSIFGRMLPDYNKLLQELL